MIESFVDAMKVYDVMCGDFSGTKEDCSDCPLCQIKETCDCLDSECVMFISTKPEKALGIINKYAEDNNLKTRMQDFFEKHPNADVKEDGTPCVCAKACGYVYKCKLPLDSEMTCHRCWNQFMQIK